MSGTDAARVRTARTILALGARILLLMVGVGILISLPPVEAKLAAAPSVSPLGLLLRLSMVLIALGALTTWIGALLYALRSPRTPPMPRALLTVLLIIGNAAAGFFYYWLYVHWLPHDETTSTIAASRV